MTTPTSVLSGMQIGGAPPQGQPPVVSALSGAAIPSRPAGFPVPPQFPTSEIPVQPETPPGRGFGDTAATRAAIYQSVLNAAKGFEPVSNDRYKLQLAEVDYDGPESYSIRDQKKAILRGESLGRKLRGTWQLTDPLGNVVDQRKTTLANVPYLTDRGTFIMGGNEYTLSHQMRLRSGVFTRQKENDELESHVNAIPGKGATHRIYMDPATGVFKFNLGQANIPLISVLRSLGVKDGQIREAWGNDLFAANSNKEGKGDIDKLYQRLVRNGAAGDLPAKMAEIKAALESTQLDPEVTKRTLGQPYDRVSSDQILRTTRKLMAVANRKDPEALKRLGLQAEEPDDRDAMAFMKLYGPEDLLSERIGKSKQLYRQMLWKATSTGTLKHMTPGMLDKALQAAIMSSGLGSPIESINPAQIFEQQGRVTRMGEGGLPSNDAVPDSSRNVQPSQFGFIDPLQTPESLKVGVDLRMAQTARKGEDGKVYVSFKDPQTGKDVWKTPQEVADSVVAFPGELRSNKKRVRGLVNGKVRYVHRNKVNLVAPAMENAFSAMSHLVPMKSGTKGQRTVMAARMTTQALPLEGAESPFVQNGMPGQQDRSFEEEYGKHMGSVVADKGGKVLGVDADSMQVQYDDGTKADIPLYNNFPYNRKSVTGDTQIFIKRGSYIRSLRIADYEWQAGDRTLSVDPVTKKSAWMQVTGFTSHRNDKQLLLVKTSSGRSVCVTEDHSLVVMGPAGSLVPCFPADVEIGRTRLPVARLPVTRYRTEADRSVGRLIGLYLSEGHAPDEQFGLVNIAVEPDDRAAEVLRLLRSLGLSPYRNGGNVCFTDHGWYTRLRNDFGHLSHGKRIADWVLHASFDLRLGLVEGYMGGDGNLWADANGAVQVTGVSVSEELRDGMVAVLSSVGVFCTLFAAPRRHLNENWRDGFGFRVISRHLNPDVEDRLPRWFFYADREAELNRLKKSAYRSSPFELVPVPDAVARKTLYTGFAETSPYVYKTAHQGAVAKDRLRGNTGPYGAWAASDVMWDVVVEILPVPHQDEVYDLSVLGSEMFAVNGGLVVHNTYIHQQPLIQPGQRFEPGRVLARSNYTDDRGAAALGINARVAYVPFRGLNFEDATVISESMAKRLRSQHMYQHGQEFEENDKKGKNPFATLFPGKFDREALDKLDDDGVIKPGMTVNFGDPLVLTARPITRTHGQLYKGRQNAFKDASQTWEHHEPGVVTDVERTKKGVVVTVKSATTMQVGDKLSGRYGDKGVVSAIIPDHEMPTDSQGRPFEILANPLGIITRINPSQIVEAALGKIAEKTGKRYKIQDFENIQDLVEFAQKELADNGLSDEEDITDPTTGRKIPAVLSGNRFFMKLHHTSESKIQGRGFGGYTADETPSKGGATGSKRIGMLDLNALFSHGATEVVRDVSLVRGQKNQDYWSAVMSGKTPPTPKIPHVYQKFVNQLRAAGINPVREKSQTHLMALTDKAIDELAGDRELKSIASVDWKNNLKPIKGGMFDEQLTGGIRGDRWSFIKLHAPMPNPVMEEPIRRVLGLTGKQFEDIIAGKSDLHGKSGPEAIGDALGKINLEREIERARQEIKGNNKGQRDAAVRRLGFLKSAQKMNMHPKDWVLSKVPVLPPKFRPVSQMQGKAGKLIADPNFLYKELFEANQNLKEMKDLVDDAGDEQLQLYRSFKAVTGLGDPVQPKNQERKVKGVLKHVFGTSPKFGTVQRKLLSSTTDLVGRAVITPDPDLDMDEVGLPEDKAWEVYKPFIVRSLVQKGMPRLRAARAVAERASVAKEALVAEMGRRPVMINRAPVLHRYGMMAAWPRLTQGSTLKISPLIVGGFNADFDGDAMQYHVPGTDEARDEAIEKMMPSKNLFSAADFDVNYKPSQEYVGGLYAASTRKGNKPPMVFATKADAIRAYREGRIGVDQSVEIVSS